MRFARYAAVTLLVIVIAALVAWLASSRPGVSSSITGKVLAVEEIGGETVVSVDIRRQRPGEKIEASVRQYISRLDAVPVVGGFYRLTVAENLPREGNTLRDRFIVDAVPVDKESLAVRTLFGEAAVIDKPVGKP